MAGQNLPIWVVVWLFFSSIMVTIDALFVILRPHTLPGGKWNYLFLHYNIYIHVDKRYADVDDTFNYGQSLTGWNPVWSVIIGVVTKLEKCITGVRFVYHEYDYRPNWRTLSLITISKKLKHNSQAMKERKKLHESMNLVEMCLNVISLIMYNRGKVGLSVLVAFMVSTMTFSKTVFYFLVSSELCGGQHFVNHNDWKSAVFLYIIPNGIWILVPFLCMVTLGNIIVDCAGNGQPTGKKTKSY